MEQATPVDLQSLEIVPLTDKKMLKGAFSISEPDHSNLLNWLKTAAWSSQAEKKSKTYIVYCERVAVGFLAVSVGSLKDSVDGLSNTTSHYPQTLLVGKLYVMPTYRGGGIGGKLLSFALDIALNMNEMVGCVGMMVDANSNEKTIAFYERFGFAEIDRDDDERTVRMFFKLPT